MNQSDLGTFAANIKSFPDICTSKETKKKYNQKQTEHTQWISSMAVVANIAGPFLNLRMFPIYLRIDKLPMKCLTVDRGNNGKSKHTG